MNGADLIEPLAFPTSVDALFGAYGASNLTMNGQRFSYQLSHLVTDMASIRWLGKMCANIGQQLEDAGNQLAPLVNPEGEAWTGQGAAAFGKQATHMFASLATMQPAYSNGGQAMLAFVNSVEGPVQFLQSQAGLLQSWIDQFQNVWNSQGGGNGVDWLAVRAQVDPILGELAAFQEIFNPAIADINAAGRQFTAQLMTISQASSSYTVFKPPPDAVQEFVDGVASALVTTLKDAIVFNPLVDPIGFAIGTIVDPKDTVDRYANEFQMLGDLTTPQGRAQLQSALANAFGDTSDIQSGNDGGFAAFIFTTVLTSAAGAPGALDRMAEGLTGRLEASAEELSSTLGREEALVLQASEHGAAALTAHDFQDLQKILESFKGTGAWADGMKVAGSKEGLTWGEATQQAQTAVEQWVKDNPYKAQLLSHDLAGLAYEKLPSLDATLPAIKEWCGRHPALATALGLTPASVKTWAEQHSLMSGLSEILGTGAKGAMGTANAGLQVPPAPPAPAVQPPRPPDLQVFTR